MKKLNFYLQKGHRKTISLPLLALSFIGGWILATWIFYFLGHGVHAALISFFYTA
jgi:hypothetical protein